jgi:predicted MFS family arabinose efflux permease
MSAAPRLIGARGRTINHFDASVDPVGTIGRATSAGGRVPNPPGHEGPPDNLHTNLCRDPRWDTPAALGDSPASPDAAPNPCLASGRCTVGFTVTGERRGQAGAGSSSLPLLILFLVNALNIFDRQALGAVLEPLRHEFGLSDTQLGALPTVFTIVYALAGLPLARLADTGSRRKLLAAGVGLWAGLTALGGLAANYWMLLATRLGVGIGEAVCAPTATSWIGDLVPPARRARAMAGFMMAVPVGVMLSFAITGPAAQAYGWRAALALGALPAVVLIPALLRLNEPARGAAGGPGAGDAGSASPLGLLRIPAFRWIVISGAVVNFILYSFSTFIAPFLTRVHGLSVARAGVWAGVGSGASGILGALAAGTLGDRTLGRGRLLLASGAALGAALPAYAALQIPAGNATPAVVLAMAAYGLLQMYYGLVYAAIQDFVEPRLRATAMAVYFLAMYLCGASFGPLITGRASDHFARVAAGTGALTEAAKAYGLHQAMYAIPLLCLVLAVVLGMGARAAAAQPPWPRG